MEKSEEPTMAGPTAHCVINFEFTRKTGGMGIPLPKRERFDKTCRVKPLVEPALACFYPPSAGGVPPCVADGKRGGINY